MRVLTTESGSVYEIDGLRVRRRNDGYKLRGDEEWLDLCAPLPEQSFVGHSAVFWIRSLAERGPDSYGNVNPDANVTTRVTSTVLTDREEDR